MSRSPLRNDPQIASLARCRQLRRRPVPELLAATAFALAFVPAPAAAQEDADFIAPIDLQPQLSAVEEATFKLVEPVAKTAGLDTQDLADYLALASAERHLSTLRIYLPPDERAVAPPPADEAMHLYTPRFDLTSTLDQVDAELTKVREQAANAREAGLKTEANRLLQRVEAVRQNFVERLDERIGRADDVVAGFTIDGIDELRALVKEHAAALQVDEPGRARHVNPVRANAAKLWKQTFRLNELADRRRQFDTLLSEIETPPSAGGGEFVVVIIRCHRPVSEPIGMALTLHQDNERRRAAGESPVPEPPITITHDDSLNVQLFHRDQWKTIQETHRQRTVSTWSFGDSGGSGVIYRHVYSYPLLREGLTNEEAQKVRDDAKRRLLELDGHHIYAGLFAGPYNLTTQQIKLPVLPEK